VIQFVLMVRAEVISDELWDVLEPVLSRVSGRPGARAPGGPWNDHRRTLEGIVRRFRTGSPWRDLPQIVVPSSRFDGATAGGRPMEPTARYSPR